MGLQMNNIPEEQTLKGLPLPSVASVLAGARRIVEHLEPSNVRACAPVQGELEQIADLADILLQPQEDNEQTARHLRA